MHEDDQDRFQLALKETLAGQRPYLRMEYRILDPSLVHRRQDAELVARVRALEASGIISRHVTLLDPLFDHGQWLQSVMLYLIIKHN